LHGGCSDYLSLNGEAVAAGRFAHDERQKYKRSADADENLDHESKLTRIIEMIN